MFYCPAAGDTLQQVILDSPPSPQKANAYSLREARGHKKAIASNVCYHLHNIFSGSRMIQATIAGRQISTNHRSQQRGQGGRVRQWGCSTVASSSAEAVLSRRSERTILSPGREQRRIQLLLMILVAPLSSQRLPVFCLLPAYEGNVDVFTSM